MFRTVITVIECLASNLCLASICSCSEQQKKKFWYPRLIYPIGTENAMAKAVLSACKPVERILPVADMSSDYRCVFM